MMAELFKTFVGSQKTEQDDEKSLQHQRPIATQITSNYQYNQGMIFGSSEAPDGSIWFGALDGVYRYDGIAIIKVEGGEERQKNFVKESQ